MMNNNLLNVPQHNLPTDTPSGCFSYLIHCLLCGGTVSTRSSISSPTRNFIDLLQNDEQVQQCNNVVELPIIARLMGLETPVDMNWKPRVIDESFNRRSRSVNSVDCLLPHFISPGLIHRRVKTCLSFSERDFLVACLEKTSKSRGAQCDQKGHQSRAKTERPKQGNGSTTNACKGEQTRHSKVRIKSYADHSNELKTGRTCCKKSVNSRSVRSTTSWQNKDDYYRKPQAIKSQSRAKEVERRIVGRSSSSKSTKHCKNVINQCSNSGLEESYHSDRVCSSPAQYLKMKAETDKLRLRAEEKRRSRKIKTVNRHGAETSGEGMMKKMKCVIEQDLEVKRWKWENESGFMYRECLSTVLEFGILDELVNQMVKDLASKCDA